MAQLTVLHYTIDDPIENINLVHKLITSRNAIPDITIVSSVDALKLSAWVLSDHKACAEAIFTKIKLITSDIDSCSVGVVGMFTVISICRGNVDRIITSLAHELAGPLVDKFDIAKQKIIAGIGQYCSELDVDVILYDVNEICSTIKVKITGKMLMEEAYRIQHIVETNAVPYTLTDVIINSDMIVFTVEG